MSCRLPVAALACAIACGLAHAAPAPRLTTQQVLDAATPADWRRPDPQHTLYLDLDAGRVVIELAPQFAPLHAANIKTLVRAHYFDGLAILRVQDNFVTQWGDPEAEHAERARSFGAAQRTLAAEFERSIDRSLPFTPLPDGDVYAREVGFSDGFPAARDRRIGKTWLAHCYGMVGAGRDNAADSGPGAELYVVIGQEPRQLDRNIALVGRVLQGMELLAALPRGSGPLGFYERPEQRVPIRRVRVAADLPDTERTPLEVLRTDTPRFAAFVESRRNRSDAWYLQTAGKIGLCNIAVPVRSAAPTTP
ncbi:MAG: peptidylprolyl isomerase [Dokdonella sp.]|uniref:peptidylprolyl isomerase n=1 Tax=Dokdonella sp. TaxID=2291710 RepID=UPI0025C667A9|nr:peptidylprolyl isomerase [Dokdonella sp.]MBX3700017.1 peptidylprolyl isomerase [Dokdonella sp.]MCW5577252.1 peptidylprolyl isomerase [Dokdonella sp.]